MVPGGEPFGSEIASRADFLDDDEVVLTACRRFRSGRVRQCFEQRGESFCRLTLGRLGCLDLSTQFLGPSQELSLLVPADTGDLFAETLLLGTEFLELDNCGSSELVCLDELVDEVNGFSTALLSGTQFLGMFTQKSGVNHPPSLASGALPTTALAGRPDYADLSNEPTAGRILVTIDLRRAVGDRAYVVPALLSTFGFLFVILSIIVVVDWEPVMTWDLGVTSDARDFSSGSAWLVSTLKVIAVVFSHWSVLAVLIVLAALAWWKRERLLAGWIIASAAVVLLGNFGLKALFSRPRPSWESPLVELGSYSFPSGHSAGIGMFTAVLVLLTIVTTGRGLRRRLFLALWILLALSVAASRVLLGVHHPVDVVAGLAFGAFVPLALWSLILANQGRWPSELAITTGSGGRRAAVIINPVKVGDIEEFKDRVRGVAAGHGWREPQWFETTIEDPGHGQTRAALDAKVDLIVAAGGDGTIRAVCETAARSGVAVGILPHGTGNLLARNLDIPVNVRDALDVVFAGQDRAIDLATFTSDSGDDTTFLVMAGLGMDAMIMSGVNEDLKKKVGYLAYFWSGIKAITFPRVKVWITIDDEEPIVFKARTVVVGNVGFLQGGIPLLPDAKIDDGLLDVVVIAPKRFIGWLAIVVRVLTRRPHNNARLSRLSGRRVHVEAEKPVPMQLDGDPAGEGMSVTAQVHSGVALVRVPLLPPPAE